MEQVSAYVGKDGRLFLTKQEAVEADLLLGLWVIMDNLIIPAAQREKIVQHLCENHEDLLKILQEYRAQVPEFTQPRET